MTHSYAERLRARARARAGLKHQAELKHKDDANPARNGAAQARPLPGTLGPDIGEDRRVWAAGPAMPARLDHPRCVAPWLDRGPNRGYTIRALGNCPDKFDVAPRYLAGGGDYHVRAMKLLA